MSFVDILDNPNFKLGQIMPILSFKSGQSIPAWDKASQSVAYAFGDLNGDGRVDVVRGGRDGTILINYQLPDGSFDQGTVLSTVDSTVTSSVDRQFPTRNSSDITIVDMNNDGHLDIINSGFGSNNDTSSMSISYGDGNGDYTTIAYPTHLYSGGAPAVADLSGDGLPDIIQVGIYSSFAMLTTGSYVDAVPVTENGQPSMGVSFVAGGSLRYAGLETRSGSTSVSQYTGAGVFADINGDNIPDLITAETSNKKIAIYQGIHQTVTWNTIPHYGPVLTGDISFIGKYDVGGWAADIATADINHDGRADIVTANSNADGTRAIDDISILLGDGAGGFSYTGLSVPDPYGLGGGWQGTNQLKLGDMDNDGNIDIVVTGIKQVAYVLLGTGTGQFSPAITVPLNYQSGNIELVDVNDDGLLDIVTSGSDIQVYINTLGNNVLETQG